MSETQGTPELTGKMFLFEKPELLSKEQHGDLGMTDPGKRFDFCSKVRAIPITVTEVPVASRDYPIIFLSKENPVLLAVVGLIDDVNLFVDENGAWETHRYIPGYARRYPFGLANQTGTDNMAIVIDTAFDGLTPNGDNPLFVNGEPSDLTKTAVDFCQAFESDRALTEEFTNRIAPLDVIRPQTAHFTPQGTTEQKVFAEYFGIDQARLGELSDEEFLSLRQGEAMGVLYSIITSMTNWRSLLQRRAMRFDLDESKITERVIN